MKRLCLVLMLLLFPIITEAQQVQRPKATSLFIEGFPINNSPVGTIMTVDYNVRALQAGKLKVTTLGFLDLEPAGKRKFYFTNHGQVVKYGSSPVGIMFEEAANRSGRFSRVGPTANLNDIPKVRVVTRSFVKVLNVSWLKAISGNIQDEVKVYLASKDVPVGIGSLNVEGFYRIRYGNRGNFGQPQIVFRPLKLSWLKFVCEIEQNGRNVDTYVGARITFVGR